VSLEKRKKEGDKMSMEKTFSLLVVREGRVEWESSGSWREWKYSRSSGWNWKAGQTHITAMVSVEGGGREGRKGWVRVE